MPGRSALLHARVRYAFGHARRTNRHKNITQRARCSVYFRPWGKNGTHSWDPLETYGGRSRQTCHTRGHLARATRLPRKAHATQREQPGIERERANYINNTGAVPVGATPQKQSRGKGRCRGRRAGAAGGSLVPAGVRASSTTTTITTGGCTSCPPHCPRSCRP